MTTIKTLLFVLGAFGVYFLLAVIVGKVMREVGKHYPQPDEEDGNG